MPCYATIETRFLSKPKEYTHQTNYICSESFQYSMTPQNNLWLFKDMNVSFSPSIDWLDGGEPAHPFFDQHKQIQAIASQIKSLFLSHALEGVQTLVRQSREPVSRQLVDCLHEQPEVWKAVLATQRYDGIYFFSRSDSRQWKEMWSGSQSTIILIRKIDDFLQDNHIGTKALNCAVHAYVHDKSIKVERETRLIPDRAISCRGENQIAVNDKSFRDTAEDNLGESKPLYDLHDFAHLTTATLCSELFGNQYHPKLTNLPPHLTALIRSPNLKLRQVNRGQTPLASDGIVFSEFLTKLFVAEVENNAQIEGQVKYTMTYQQLTASLASKVAEYLMGRSTIPPGHQSNLLPRSPQYNWLCWFRTKPTN